MHSNDTTLGKIDGRRRRGRQRMRWLDVITDSMDMSLEVGDGQGSLACCSPWGCKESDNPEWLNWIISDVDHFCMCFSAICMSSLEKCSFVSYTHFLIRLFLDVDLLLYFSRLILWQLLHLQTLSPILRVTFHFVHSFLWLYKRF